MYLFLISLSLLVWKLFHHFDHPPCLSQNLFHLYYIGFEIGTEQSTVTKIMLDYTSMLYYVLWFVPYLSPSNSQHFLVNIGLTYSWTYHNPQYSCVVMASSECDIRTFHFLACFCIYLDWISNFYCSVLCLAISF